jgi:hypothetical protein
LQTGPVKPLKQVHVPSALQVPVPEQATCWVWSPTPPVARLVDFVTQALLVGQVAVGPTGGEPPLRNEEGAGGGGGVGLRTATSTKTSVNEAGLGQNEGGRDRSRQDHEDQLDITTTQPRTQSTQQPGAVAGRRRALGLHMLQSTPRNPVKQEHLKSDPQRPFELHWFMHEEVYWESSKVGPTASNRASCRRMPPSHCMATSQRPSSRRDASVFHQL